MTESLKRVSMVLLALAITLGLSGVLTLGITNSASATTDKKITICHARTNVKKPYGPKAITVNKNAADGIAGNSGKKPDHFGEHTGPLATSVDVAKELKKDKIKWGDIIPPIDGVHEGLNWPEGQAILENNCQVPGSEPEDEEYLFQFAKEWDGDTDKVNFDSVDVTFYIGETPWKLGDDPVEVEPGQVLSPLKEVVTGLPANCTSKSDLPGSYTVFEDMVPSDLRALTMEDETDTDEPMLETLEVTNTVTCTTTPVTPEGETETPVTPAGTTTQVTATPTGAVDAGAGADIATSLAGLMSSAAVVAAGVFLRRFTVVSL